MHNFRNTRFCKAICLFLVVLITTTSCAKEELVSPTVIVAKDYSSEQLFKGIYLMQGEVASKISFFQPYLQAVAKAEANNPAVKKARAQQADELFKAVKSLDPAFPDELRRAITSRNFTTVEETLEKGAMLLKSAVLVNKRNSEIYKQGQKVIKSMDLTKYNFKSEKGLADFIKDAKKVSISQSNNIKTLASDSDRHNDELVDTGNPFPTDDIDECFMVAAAVALVVAAVVWEVAGAVNVVAVVSVALGVFAVVATVGAQSEETDGTTAAKPMIDNLERELMIKEITLDIL